MLYSYTYITTTTFTKIYDWKNLKSFLNETAFFIILKYLQNQIGTMLKYICWSVKTTRTIEKYV